MNADSSPSAMREFVCVLYMAERNSHYAVSSFQSCTGSRLQTMRVREVTKMRITYTPLPPSQPNSADAANSDVDIAGPMARTTEAETCARPFVPPSDLLLGAAAATYMKMEAGRRK